MCFFTKYQTFTHVLFAVKRFGVFSFALIENDEEGFLVKSEQKKNWKSERWVMRTIYTFFLLLIFAVIVCWCLGSRFSFPHICWIQPNNTESVQHIWYRKRHNSIKPHCHQSAVPLPPPCMCQDVALHAINIFKIHFYVNGFFLVFHVILKCKLPKLVSIFLQQQQRWIVNNVKQSGDFFVPNTKFVIARPF